MKTQRSVVDLACLSALWKAARARQVGSLDINCSSKEALLSLILLAAPMVAPAQQPSDFTYTSNGNTVTITGYIGPGGAVTIPDMLNGLPVASIGAAAFRYCANLTTVTIPNSVTSIGNMAFYFCTNLASVTLLNGVTSIGAWAFESCSLTSVTIPSSVTSIGDDAFCCCTNLASVTLLNGVTGIGEGAFRGCTGLKTITIPDSVTSLGDEAFESCYGLTTATIGDRVSTIGVWAFFCCYSLRSITIPNSVTTIGNMAFYCCTNLTGVTIPGGVIGIGDAAFQATGLTNVLIPDTVTSIGVWGFASCFSLTNVTIGNGVTSIGDWAFICCSSLEAITVAPLNPGYSSLEGVLFDKSRTTIIQCPAGKAGIYTIPSGVTTIGDEAFGYCVSLIGVTIPSSVTSIGNSAFCNCTGLTEACFQGNAPSLGSGVFEGDSNATVYYLPGTTGWGATFGGIPALPWNLSPPPAPVALRAQGLPVPGIGEILVLSWTSPSFSLRAAPTPMGGYTNVPGATSPYAVRASGPQMFFRLQSNP
jgi:Flp pilus assembly protein protease CpaA